jgi:hypothetical protein
MPHVNVMDWRWVMLALVLPTILGVLVALPVWWKGKEPIVGGMLGLFPVAVATVAFIGREYIELERFNQECRRLLDSNIICRQASPEAFTRFGIYCFIGLLQAVVLFSLSLWVEGRRQRRAFAEGWRDRRN